MVAGGVPGSEVTIEVVRERAWGSVWRIGIDRAPHWLKVPHRALTREVRLRRVLEHRAPHGGFCHWCEATTTKGGD